MVAQKNSVKHIWMLSREYGDLAGAGGIKDVVSQLSKSLARWSGRSVHVVLPLYGFMSVGGTTFKVVDDPLSPGRKLSLAVDMNLPDKKASESVTFYHALLDKVHVYLVDAKRFSDKKSVYTYTKEEETGQDFHSLAVADFDNDGDVDIFSGGGPLSTNEIEMFIWENKASDGSLWVEHPLIKGKMCHEAVAADVDGDGDFDICTKPWKGDDLHLYLENKLIDGKK